MSQDDHNLPNDVEQLQAMIAEQSSALAERDATIVEHRETIVAHSETIAQHETVIAAQQETIEKQLQKLDGLQQQLARLLRRQYGPQKEGKEPSRFLEGFRGYLQADAFSGYDQLYQSGQVIEVACMAHCRRYWWEAKQTDSRHAHEAISYIARLYELPACTNWKSSSGKRSSQTMPCATRDNDTPCRF